MVEKVQTKLVILGNPTSDLSSGKGLLRICNLASDTFECVEVVNDGRVRVPMPNVNATNYTGFIARAKSRGENSGSALLLFALGQVLLFFGLMRRQKGARQILLLPISYPLPLVLAKLLGRRTFLLENQDVLREEATSFLSRFRRGILVSFRNVSLRLVDVIVVEGRHTIRWNSLWNYASKVVERRNYVDLSRYSPINRIEDRPKLVGFVAGLEYRKGAGEFAESIKILHKTKPEYRCIIVGDGPLRPKLEHNLSDLLQSGVVKMVGSVSELELPSLLNGIRLLVLPSRSEGMPNIIIESMSCGTPVLATPVGAIPDLIRDGTNGFLTYSLSPAIIASQMASILEDELGLARASILARKSVEHEFDYPVVASSFRRIFFKNVIQS